MSKQKEDLKIALDELALSIASHVKSDTVLFADRLDAFKALTAYHLGLTKVGKKSGEPSKEGENFDAFRKQVETSGE
jgi:hypothetical protein